MLKELFYQAWFTDMLVGYFPTLTVGDEKILLFLKKLLPKIDIWIRLDALDRVPYFVDTRINKLHLYSNLNRTRYQTRVNFENINSLTSLKLENINVNKACMKEICMASKNYNLKSLSLKCCFLRHNAVYVLADFLELSECKLEYLKIENTLDENLLTSIILHAMAKNKSVKELKIPSSDASGIIVDTALANVFDKNKTLELLDVSYCFFLKPKVAVKSLTKCKLKSLILRSIDLDDETEMAMYKSLNENSDLETLNISSNGISNDTIDGLCKFIVNNKTLKELNVSRNGIDDIGHNKICEALIKNNSIIKYSASCIMITNSAIPKLSLLLNNNNILKSVDMSMNEMNRGILKKMAKKVLIY